jgi:MFS family permease
MSTEVANVKYWTKSSIIALVFGCLVPLALTGTGMTVVMVNLPNVMSQWSAGATDIAPSMMLVTATAWLFGLIGSRAIDKMTPKYALCFGSVVTGIYVLIEAFAPNIIVFTLGGVFCGAGMGLGSIAGAIAFSEQFFGDQAGRVGAICLCAMQIGGALLSALIATGMKFLPDWHQVLIIYGIVCTVIGGLFEIIFIRKPSPEVQARVAELKALKHSTALDASGAGGITVKEGIKTPSFWLFIIGMMLGAIVLATFGTYGTVFMGAFGMAPADATYFTSFSLFFCGINVLWTGALLERKVGARNYLIIYNILIIIGVVVIFIWAGLSLAAGVPVLLGLIVVNSFFMSFDQCTTNVPAILVPKVFGHRDFNGFQSAFTGFYYLGVFTAQLTSAIIFEAMGPIAMIVYCGITVVASMICFLAALGFSKHFKEHGRLAEVSDKG